VLVKITAREKSAKSWAPKNNEKWNRETIMAASFQANLPNHLFYPHLNSKQQYSTSYNRLIPQDSNEDATSLIPT